MLSLSVMRRRPWMLASLASNAVLAGALLVSWTQHMRPQRAVAGTVHESLATPQAAVAEPSTAATSSLRQAAQTFSFHWSQLEAPDFATFTQNLRGIGCPEATIHDIIAGELREIYATKRLSAEQALAKAPEAKRIELQESVRSLAAEEAAMLASLMAPAPNSTTGSALSAPATVPEVESESKMTPSTAAAATAAPAARDSMLTPAAFLVGNDPARSSSLADLGLAPDDAMLDPATAQVITQLRQDFAQSLPQESTSPAADTSSLLYRTRWQAAQRQSDEVFSSLFGGDAFVRLQMEAMQKQQTQAAAR